jgi:hypothetical protein
MASSLCDANARSDHARMTELTMPTPESVHFIDSPLRQEQQAPVHCAAWSSGLSEIKPSNREKTRVLPFSMSDQILCSHST